MNWLSAAIRNFGPENVFHHQRADVPMAIPGQGLKR
jgi:hypothetical protein